LNGRLAASNDVAQARGLDREAILGLAAKGHQAIGAVQTPC
jgi:hypothetical protein